MKRYTLIVATLLSLLIPVQGWSADFLKGYEAYNSGDYSTALKEWRPLAEQGNADAQLNLGYMYTKGQGVFQDYVKAHMWNNISASNGNDAGGKNRDLIAKLMTPSQIEKAQDLARECVKKEYKGC